MHTIIPMIVLVFTYLALSANLQFSNLILGIVIAIGILSLLRFPRHPVKWARLPLAFMALAIFMGTLLYNVIRSGIQIGGFFSEDGREKTCAYGNQHFRIYGIDTYFL